MLHSFSRNFLLSLLFIPYPRRVVFLPDCANIIFWILLRTSRGMKDILVSSASIERIILILASSESDIWISISIQLSSFSLCCRSMGFFAQMSLS